MSKSSAHLAAIIDGLSGYLVADLLLGLGTVTGTGGELIAAILPSGFALALILAALKFLR